MRTPFLAVAFALITGMAACDSGGEELDGGGRIDAPSGTGGTGGGGGTGGTGGAGGTGGGGGTGGASLGCGVGGGGSSSCSKAELDTYNNCTYAACETQFKACYGAGVMMGNFSGPCGTFITCTSKCACTNLTCLLACGAPSNECIACGQAVATCQESSSCTKPACLRTPDGGVTLPDGGFPFPFDGGLPDGLFGGTCADLTACCAAIADTAKKAQCTAVLGAAAGSDLACGAAYSGYKANGDCP
jgi:hypothetical protein